MGRLDIPISDHQEIRRSPEMQAALGELIRDIAREAGELAGDPDGYDTDITVGTDRARGHVWAESRKAIAAETKHSPLLQVRAGLGGS